MRLYRSNSPEAEEALRGIIERRSATNENALRVADEMIAGVRATGDMYVAAQIAKFDRVNVEPSKVKIAPRDVAIGADIAEAIDTAITRVEAFHRAQMPQSCTWRDGGSTVQHRVRALRRVGCYVPGGRAVYISTLIMTAVPARIAGVEEIVCITTPAAAEREELHYVCNRLGIREIYRCGGAAGVAAAALGTQSLARVDKIVGPGNSYVTAAKMRLIGEVGIDMTAGPTELVVIADDTADPVFVQADLDAQQEHGADSVVTCISIGKPLDVRATQNIVVGTREEAIAIANRIAPEHLSIQTRDPQQLADLADNCGAVFCGPFSPVAAGDYVAGPNHVLPTSGSARFFSVLGVYDFVKRSNVISLTADELMQIAPSGEAIAKFEGLPAHAASIEKRRTACLAAA